MSREEYIRASVAIAATRLFPTTVRDAVISDVKFTEGFGLKANAIIRFGRDDLTFQRSAFFDSIRQAFHPGHEPVPVDNTQGETWEIRILADKSPIQITLARGTTRLLVSHFGVLSPSKDIRLATLFHEADNVCFSPEEIAPWKEMIEERALTDDEVILIEEDLKDTPIAVASIIREHLGFIGCMGAAICPVLRTACGPVGERTFARRLREGGRTSSIQRTFEMARSRGTEARSSPCSAALSKRGTCRSANRRRHAPGGHFLAGRQGRRHVLRGRDRNCARSSRQRRSP